MDYEKNFEQWLQSDELSQDEKARLRALNEEEKKEMFFCPLQFGTAGMRGVLDLGTNRMNVFTVRRATKGLAEYIKTLGEEAMQRGVVISYDTRRFSSEFSIEVAKVLAKNNINTYLFDTVHPVPMCSFAIRRLNAIAGVMITASHNPKNYNGYKVYGEDGAQMSPESTDKVVEFIDKTPYFGICEAEVDLTADNIKGLDNQKVHPYITVIGKSVDNAYFDTISKLSLSPEAVEKYGKNVKIVYTPVHGSGYMPVTMILSRMGITVNVVKEQALPDTEFSTVRVPNPEEADTLRLGVELADKIGSDVVIGTDPTQTEWASQYETTRANSCCSTATKSAFCLQIISSCAKKKRALFPKTARLSKQSSPPNLRARLQQATALPPSTFSPALSLSAKKSKSGNKAENIPISSASKKATARLWVRMQEIRTQSLQA